MEQLVKSTRTVIAVIGLLQPHLQDKKENICDSVAFPHMHLCFWHDYIENKDGLTSQAATKVATIIADISPATFLWTLPTSGLHA